MGKLSAYSIFILSVIFVSLIGLTIKSPIFAQTPGGAACVYSTGPGSCFLGNCLDGSQNCNTNSNCGFVPGYSSGRAVSCPDGNSPFNNPTQNINPAPPAPTPIPTCNYTEDCDAGDGFGSGTHVCTGTNQGGACMFDGRVNPNCSVCKPKTSAQLNTTDANGPYDPNTISLGQPVNITITTSRSCSSSPSLTPGPGLIGDNPDGTCVVTQQLNCNNSGDWSKKCTTTFACKAAHETGQFSATYTSDNPDCTVNYPYTINPPNQCRNTANNAPPNPSDTQVKASSLSDDQQIAGLEAQGLMPQDLNNKIVTDAQNKDAKPDASSQIGVEEGFFGLKKSLLCNNPLVRFIIGGFTGSFCPEVVNLADNKTNVIHDQSQQLALEERPGELRPSPANADCVLHDINISNTDQNTKTQGNQKVDDVNTSFDTVYGKDLPQFDPSQLQLNQNQNLTVGGLPLNKDERVPDVNKKCELYQQANFPNGITICQNQ